jgi:hypothetical protein
VTRPATRAGTTSSTRKVMGTCSPIRDRGQEGSAGISATYVYVDNFR